MDLKEKTSARICPICSKAVAAKGENKVFPFCSERCQLADLGNWLDGVYTLPDNGLES